MDNTIYKSGEDYLEACLYVEKTKNGVIKSIEVANFLGVSRPSACRALNILCENGFIVKEKYNAITLTKKGRQKALEIVQKHTAITNFLIYVLKVTPEVAEQDACKIEHDLSQETTEKLFAFMKNLSQS